MECHTGIQQLIPSTNGVYLPLFLHSFSLMFQYLFLLFFYFFFHFFSFKISSWWLEINQGKTDIQKRNRILNFTFILIFLHKLYLVLVYFTSYLKNCITKNKFLIELQSITLPKKMNHNYKDKKERMIGLVEII
jgi:hypothetical protein